MMVASVSEWQRWMPRLCARNEQLLKVDTALSEHSVSMDRSSLSSFRRLFSCAGNGDSTAADAADPVADAVDSLRFDLEGGPPTFSEQKQKKQTSTSSQPTWFFCNISVHRSILFSFP